VLAFAVGLGASDVSAELSESVGLAVSVRKGELERIERSQDKSLEVSVYVGQRSGNASTSDFSRSAVEQAVRAAYDIARFTAEDPAAGLAEPQDLASATQVSRDLDLFYRCDLQAEQAINIAQRCELAAMQLDARVTNSEGASFSSEQSHFFAGNSRGFRGGYANSEHGINVAPIASSPGKLEHDMQRGYWYSVKRNPGDLASPEDLGRYAAQRALSRLKSRKIKTCEVPVLFESSEATDFLGHYVRATSGGSLYRRSSFLVDSLGKQVLAEHIDLHENPFLPKGLASSMFDDDGVATVERDIVQAGVVESYFLSSYSARKLGLRTTGHAGGAHNLYLTSRLTQPGDDLPAMLRKLHRGLFVVELMGDGVNYVTGDYSRGAAGFWVENGQIAYPVHEITIAGNLRDMLKSIVAVGADTFTSGRGWTSGSVLIEKMKIAGT
jgi:PmbA protein